jgi:F0F1-type ATP synthase membrane subunit c/vacuolar-type H+-ATPase subunit K
MSRANALGSKLICMDQQNQPSLDARLRVLRIIWAALLMGQVIFIAVIVWFVWPGQTPGQQMTAELRQIFLYVGIAMLAGAIPVGYIVRRMVYRPAPDGTVTAGNYASGNILLWAMSEGVSFFALVAMLLDGKPWPFLAIALVAMANQVISFPTGNGVR